MCPHCDKLLSCQRVLKRHITLRHLKNGRFECPKCSKRFFQRMELDMHMLVHTNERKHTCGLCAKGFKQSAHLSQHMKVVHVGNKPFVCELCAEKFGSKENLKSHLSTHGTVKLFKCEQCPSSFKHKTSVYSHVKRVHAHNRDSICDACDAGFNTGAKLKRHKKNCTTIPDMKEKEN